MSGTGSSTSLPAISREERATTVLVFVLFLAVGLNSIGNHAYIGQDYDFHTHCVNRILGDSGRFFFNDFTNRPMPYLVASGTRSLLGAGADIPAASLVFLVSNALALLLFHDCARRLVVDPWLRLSALFLAAFLPAIQITSVVFAADGTAPLPFMLGVWSCFRLVEASSRTGRIGFGLLAGFAFAVGNLCKFSFLLAPLGLGLVAFLLLRGWGSGERRARSLLFYVVFPALLTGACIQYAVFAQIRHDPWVHTYDKNDPGLMSWRSLLLPRLSDRQIFEAPSYYDTEIINGVESQFLINSNRFSYPALLHLALFTDVNDFANQGTLDLGAPRPAFQRKMAILSVYGGLLFSLALVYFWIRYVCRLVSVLWDRGRPGELPTHLWFLPSLAWYLPLTLQLPYIIGAYQCGYWLPRLVIPWVWTSCVLPFHGLDSCTAEHPWLSRAVFGLVLVQSTFHLGSLWY